VGSSPKWHGPFWEYDLFGAQIIPLQLITLHLLNNLKNFPSIFPIIYQPCTAEQAAYRNVCAGLGVKWQKASRNTSNGALMETSAKG
jgi:hypothetical protein